MNSRVQKLLIFAGIIVVSLAIGGNVAAYAMSGVITLISLIALMENIGWLKSIAYHCNALFDIAIFVLGVYCKLNLGVTIGMAVMYAGLGYSLVYGPYMKDIYKLKNK